MLRLKKLKQKLITEIVIGVNHLNIGKKNYFYYSLQAFAEGNAFFMAFSRYDSEYDKLEKKYKEEFGGDLKKFVRGMTKN